MKKKSIFKSILYIVVILGVIALFTPTLLKNQKFGLDLQGGFEVLYEVKSIDGGEVTKDMVTSTYKTISKRIDVLGVTEPTIIVEGENRIRVQLAGVTDPTEARNTLSQVASLTFRDTSDNLLMNSDVLKSGGAKVGQDETGRPAVSLSVKDKNKFYEVTKAISEKEDNRIVIWLDFDENSSFQLEQSKCGSLSNSKCLSVASVSQGFASDVIIQGNFTQEEVENLVNLINSGSLPTKLEEVSSKTVGAEFGEGSLEKTFKAGIVGILLIMALMIVVYHFSGLIASVGIVIYTFLTFLTFWLVGGVLTLPGIAALVIGIGMAIDSCVISFARIKDELNSGSKLNVAYKNGNKNAFSSIFDSNITTLLAALILFIFGESSVKGFATMLIISTIVTMLVMVVLIRFLLGLFVKTGKFDNKLNLFIGYKKVKKQRKFNFVKIRKFAYIYLVLLVILGIYTFTTNKLKLGIDFKGGSSVTLVSNQELTEKEIRKDIKELEYNLYEIELLDDNTVIAKVEETLTKDQVLTTEKYFQEKYEAKTDIGVVSNVVKQELVKNAIIALILASIGIVLYVSIRFRFSYALSGVVALIHDAFIIFVIFSLFKLEVSSIFIAAILSIIGYSINDTIVTFDRIRENIRNKKKLKTKEDLEEVINEGLNATLKRSIITTLTTLCPVICLIVLGSHEIINFNLALLFGLIAGVLSSIFVACQLLFDLEKKNINKPIKKKWYEETEPEEKKIKGINA
ncbi:MAG: protein translocase subunit SecD [Firmicutes bacterium]|nr:protein translocase subunit SecD [Bacillota bacterium]